MALARRLLGSLPVVGRVSVQSPTSSGSSRVFASRTLLANAASDTAATVMPARNGGRALEDHFRLGQVPEAGAAARRRRRFVTGEAPPLSAISYAESVSTSATDAASAAADKSAPTPLRAQKDDCCRVGVSSCRACRTVSSKGEGVIAVVRPPASAYVFGGGQVVAAGLVGEHIGEGGGGGAISAALV